MVGNDGSERSLLARVRAADRHSLPAITRLNRFAARCLETRLETIANGAVLIAALWFVAAFLWVSFSRIGYPYDLEWMLGGMLTHSLRLLEGKPLFGPPSVEFIPYIYQPLYSIVVALLGRWLVLSLPLARGVSIASTWVLAGLLFRTVQRETGSYRTAFAGTGLLFALYSATGYWYDLARVDTFFLALVFLGLYVARYHAGKVWAVPAAALLMVGAYFTKQTAVLFIPLGFPLFLAARRSHGVGFLAATVLAIGGLSLAADQATDGWYSFYVQSVVASEPASWQRIHHDFWLKAARDLPVVLAVVVVEGVVRLSGRTIRDLAGECWYLATAAGMVSGVLSYSWQGGFDNNFLPFYVFAIIPACQGLAWAWRRAPVPWSLVGSGALLVQLFILLYNPVRQVPSREEVEEGGRLIELLAGSAGPVLIPEHPWYAVLAGKRPSYHSMALEDLRHKQKGMWPEDLRARLRDGYYSTVVISWDPARRSLGNYPPELRKYYQRVSTLRFRGRAMGSYVGTWARPTFVYRPRPQKDSPG